MAQQVQQKRHPLLFLGFIGGFAANTAEVITFPIDNIKTRMQMNGKEGLPSYTSSVDCVKKTFQGQGFRKGFYRGFSAAFCRQMIYSSSRMFLYESINRVINKNNPNPAEVGFLKKFLAGGTAGALGCILGSPTDVFKIRLVNDIMATKYKGLIDVYKQTISTDGYPGLFKGTNVNVLRAVIVNAAELAFYDTTKSLLISYLQLDATSKLTHFLSSFSAGFFGSVLSSPADVIKTRYMNQMKGATKENPNTYTGIADCFVKIYKQEGFRAFYKGFFPLFVRLTPWNICFFMSYEFYKAKTIHFFN